MSSNHVVPPAAKHPDIFSRSGLVPNEDICLLHHHFLHLLSKWKEDMVTINPAHVPSFLMLRTSIPLWFHCVEGIPVSESTLATRYVIVACLTQGNHLGYPCIHPSWMPLEHDQCMYQCTWWWAMWATHKSAKCLVKASPLFLLFQAWFDNAACLYCFFFNSTIFTSYYYFATIFTINISVYYT